MSANHSTSGGGAGKDAGKRTGGAFNAMHGAGEAIRGNINDFLDQGGDAVAGREHGSVSSREAGGENHGATAAKGAGEYNKGVAEMKGK
ncbi:hypothetical protein JCM8202_005462 [Rhodotorula sphaerocarpa]